MNHIIKKKQEKVLPNHDHRSSKTPSIRNKDEPSTPNVRLRDISIRSVFLNSLQVSERDLVDF